MYLEHYERDMVCEKCIVDYPFIGRKPAMLDDEYVPKLCPEKHPRSGDLCYLWFPHEGDCLTVHIERDSTAKAVTLHWRSATEATS